MKKIKNKKGEITTQQIVFLIILITSFVVILFFFFRLNLGEVSNKEICHNSVVLKGKASSFSGGNLDCKTNYLCISSGGECEGINPTQTVKVNANDKDEILKAIADEMVDCWWQFGEGKVKYVDEYVGTHCAICSSVRFDEKLKDNKISYNDIFEYLLKTKKSETQTFYQYLYPYFPKLDDLFENSVYLSGQKTEDLDLTESFSIVTGMNKEFSLEDLNPFKKSGTEDDLITPVYFVRNSDVQKLGCTVFDITKA